MKIMQYERKLQNSYWLDLVVRLFSRLQFPANMEKTIYNSKILQFADEYHVIWQKAPEHVLNRPSCVTVFSISITALIILQRTSYKMWNGTGINDEESTKGNSKWNLCSFCWNFLQALIHTLWKYPYFRITGSGFMRLSKFDQFSFCLKLHILGVSKEAAQTGASDLIHCNIAVHGDIMGHGVLYFKPGTL